jgi:hypothetical protein
MTFIKSEVVWLHQHARQDRDGAWWCKKTGKPIATALIGRSIHMAGFSLAGSGEVRGVTHLACSSCDPNKKPPRYGEAIVETELIETIDTTEWGPCPPCAKIDAGRTGFCKAHRRAYVDEHEVDQEIMELVRELAKQNGIRLGRYKAEA